MKFNNNLVLSPMDFYHYVVCLIDQRYSNFPSKSNKQRINSLEFDYQPGAANFHHVAQQEQTLCLFFLFFFFLQLHAIGGPVPIIRVKGYVSGITFFYPLKLCQSQVTVITPAYHNQHI